MPVTLRSPSLQVVQVHFRQFLTNAGEEEKEEGRRSMSTVPMFTVPLPPIPRCRPSSDQELSGKPLFCKQLVLRGET